MFDNSSIRASIDYLGDRFHHPLVEIPIEVRAKAMYGLVPRELIEPKGSKLTG